jgi:hypothetical protein
MFTLVLTLAIVTQNPPPPPGVPGPPGVTVQQAPPGTPVKTMPQQATKTMPQASPQAPVVYSAPQTGYALPPIAIPINPCIRELAYPGYGGCQVTEVVMVKQRRLGFFKRCFGHHRKARCVQTACVQQQTVYAQQCSGCGY